MASTRDIGIYLIAKTELNRAEAAEWLAAEHDTDLFGEGGILPRDVTPAAALVGLAAKRCYRSFRVGLNPNVSRIRADWAAYLANVLASGHGSVLEHASYTFALEGVSRVFTAEMNRHRAGWAISEQSLRFVRLDDLEYWLPTEIADDPNDGKDLWVKKKITQRRMQDAFARAEETIRELSQLWAVDSLPFAEKKRLTSMFRRLVPMGVATGGTWTGNVRALRHVMTMRCAPEAEAEICHVFSRIAKRIVDAEPMLFGDFEEIDGFWRPKHVKV